MKKNLGLAICGSFCNFEKTFETMKRLKEEGYNILPILSHNASQLDTRFGSSKENIEIIKKISGQDPIINIEKAEPIGPKNLVDLLVVMPCTGNTIGKLVVGIIDSPVTMAVKSHLRNQKPVLIGVATNDGLSGSAKNIGELLNRKNIFFIPMRQDDPQNKPMSIVANFDLTSQAVELALKYRQMQPIYI